MKRRQAIGPKERDVIAYLDHTVKSTGFIPSQWAIARATGILFEAASAECQPSRRWHRLLGKAQGCKEANAIACLNRTLAATKMVPTKSEIGQAVGAHPVSLSRMKVFAARYGAALSRHRAKVRPRSKNPAAQEDEAIAFLQETIHATGCRPSLSEIAGYVGADRHTLLKRVRFAARWRAALAAYTRRASPRGHNRYKGNLEQRAIELFNAVVESTGIRPPVRTIARQAPRQLTRLCLGGRGSWNSTKPRRPGQSPRGQDRAPTRPRSKPSLIWPKRSDPRVSDPQSTQSPAPFISTWRL